MSDVVKKVADPTYLTHQVVRSANTPDYPTADWLINPSGIAALDAAEVPEKYWDVVASDVEEMDAGEKAAVDAAAVVPLSGIARVTSDPTSVAVNADEGTILQFEDKNYRKMADGEDTDVEEYPSLADGEAGKAYIDLSESSSAPTLAAGRFWYEDDGLNKKLVWSDGTDKYEVTLTKV